MKLVYKDTEGWIPLPSPTDEYPRDIQPNQLTMSLMNPKTGESIPIRHYGLPPGADQRRM